MQELNQVADDFLSAIRQITPNLDHRARNRLIEGFSDRCAIHVEYRQIDSCLYSVIVISSNDPLVQNPNPGSRLSPGSGDKSLSLIKGD